LQTIQSMGWSFFTVSAYQFHNSRCSPPHAARDGVASCNEYCHPGGVNPALCPACRSDTTTSRLCRLRLLPIAATVRKWVFLIRRAVHERWVAFLVSHVRSYRDVPCGIDVVVTFTCAVKLTGQFKQHHDVRYV